MKFLGNNFEHYPNGRTLSFYGTESCVHEAKEYIQQKYIEPYQNELRMEQERENQENVAEFEQKMLIPKSVAKKLAQIKVF